MQGVLEGFGLIVAVIAVGFALAHIGLLREDSQRVLTRLAFFVATPALLFRLLAGTNVGEVLSAPLAVAAISVAASAAIHVVVARGLWRMPVGETVIGTLSACYVNAGNLGLPIAIYALGNGSLIAPVLLLQLLVITPTAFAILDGVIAGQRLSLGGLVTMPLRNPITVGSFLGLLCSVLGWQVPGPIDRPVEMIGGMAVPAVLLAYGISLRLGPRPLGGVAPAQVVVVSVLKLVVQPVVAYLVGRWVFGLDGLALLSVTVIAALPTAQNIFVYATRYGRATVLARDAIFVTTVLSVPAVLAITALLA